MTASIPSWPILGHANQYGLAPAAGVNPIGGVTYPNLPPTTNSGGSPIDGGSPHTTTVTASPHTTTFTGTMTYSIAADSGSRKTITTTQPHGGKQQHGGKGECFDTAYGCCHYWFAITSGGTSAAHSHGSKDHNNTWSPSGASAAKTTASSSGVH